MSEKKVYFNKPQRLTQLIGANTTVIVARRRTGKTDSIAAPFVLRNMQRMPGSTDGIVVPTFENLQLLGENVKTNPARIENRRIPLKLTPHEANLPSPRKICSNTAPTAPMLSILYTSVAKNSRPTIPSPSPCRAYRDCQLAIYVSN